MSIIVDFCIESICRLTVRERFADAGHVASNSLTTEFKQEMMDVTNDMEDINMESENLASSNAQTKKKKKT